MGGRDDAHYVSNRGPGPFGVAGGATLRIRTLLCATTMTDYDSISVCIIRPQLLHE
jgi:hypothetical protein